MAESWKIISIFVVVIGLLTWSLCPLASTIETTININDQGMYGTEKKCSICSTIKPINDFYKTANKRWLHAECKKCHNVMTLNHKRTKKGLVSNIYGHQRSYSRKHILPDPPYTNKELLEFALNSDEFNKLFDLWVVSGYSKLKIPTFDRLDDYKSYSFDNFNKWMSWEDNKRKGNIDRVNGINNKHSVAVKQFDKSGNLINTFHSRKQAERITGVCNSRISSVCNGKRKTAGGFIWKNKT